MANKIDARFIAESLGNPRRSGNGFMVRCPAHDDKNPSLYVADGRDGSIVLKCFADCTCHAVRDVLQSRGLWPTRNKDTADKGKVAKGRDDFEVVAPIPDDAPPIDYQKIIGFEPTSVFHYKNSKGQVMFIVARRDHDKN